MKKGLKITLIVLTTIAGLYVGYKLYKKGNDNKFGNSEPVVDSEKTAIMESIKKIASEKNLETTTDSKGTVFIKKGSNTFYTLQITDSIEKYNWTLAHIKNIPVQMDLIWSKN